MHYRQVPTPGYADHLPSVWQHAFGCFEEARSTIGRWIRFYNQERPHQALNYQSPDQFRAQQQLQVA